MEREVNNSADKIRVTIVIEPPMPWPLWFGNQIFDQQELAPISEALKQDCRDLCSYFVANTVWGGDYIGYLWATRDLKDNYNFMLNQLKYNLANELGDGYFLDDRTCDLGITQ
jgi:hypothetical protein